MKHLKLVGVAVGALVLLGCESTKSTGEGNQEAKRRAAIAQDRQNDQMDESHRNLWNAQHDRINTDGNPARNYY